MKEDKKTQRVETRLTEKQNKLLEQQVEELKIKKGTLIRLFIVEGLWKCYLGEDKNEIMGKVEKDS
ncbi:hypothetical protein [Enterococcus sp. MSG4854]|uniref:hypothetical protein n=1 Tax=unclassified Enterococcus TaxID=2608891 RepID=UPI003D2FC48A